jgi:hypothetical protein
MVTRCPSLTAHRCACAWRVSSGIKWRSGSVRSSLSRITTTSARDRVAGATTYSTTTPQMQGFDWRVPAADDHKCKPATARRRGRWCSHPRLWGGCVGERVSSALSEPRPVRTLARNASRQPRECATPRYRWARYRGDRWVVCACSHRARTRSVGAFDAGDGCRTAPRRGCGPLNGAHHCGDDRDGSSPSSCVRDDAARRTRNPVDTDRWCDHHGRRLSTGLHTAIPQSAQFHWMRPTLRMIRNNPTRWSYDIAGISPTVIVSGAHGWERSWSGHS